MGGRAEMANEEYIINRSNLSEAAQEKKRRLETDPSSRTDHMAYMPGMEQIQSDVMEKVMTHVKIMRKRPTLRRM